MRGVTFAACLAAFFIAGSDLRAQDAAPGESGETPRMMRSPGGPPPPGMMHPSDMPPMPIIAAPPAMLPEKPLRYTVVFNQGISGASIEKLMGIAVQAEVNNAAELRILFSSDGGDIGTAITFNRFIKGMKVPVHIHGIGMIASSANYIFIAGDKRTIDPYAIFLIHRHTFTVQRHEDSQAYNEIQDTFKRHNATIAAMMADKSDLDIEMLAGIMNGGPHMLLEAEAAIEAGMADAIEPGGLTFDSDTYTELVYTFVVDESINRLRELQR